MPIAPDILSGIEYALLNSLEEERLDLTASLRTIAYRSADILRNLEYEIQLRDPSSGVKPYESYRFQPLSFPLINSERSGFSFLNSTLDWVARSNEILEEFEATDSNGRYEIYRSARREAQEALVLSHRAARRVHRFANAASYNLSRESEGLFASRTTSTPSPRVGQTLAQLDELRSAIEDYEDANYALVRADLISRIVERAYSTETEWGLE